MAKFYIHPTARIGTLGDKQVNDIAEELSTMKIENNLRRSLRENIERLRVMGTYRGRRHAMGLPVRGQNTRTQVRRHGRLLSDNARLSFQAIANHFVQIITARRLNKVERRG